MLYCKIFRIQGSNQGFLTHFPHLPKGIFWYDMFLKWVNAKKILAGHASWQASIPPRAGRVSVLVARASHVTNCLRFRLAQRYLPGVNQRALTDRNRTNSRGRVSAAPRPWCLTPFSQDPIIGTTTCIIDHWKQRIFSSYLSVFFNLIPLIMVQSNLVVTCTTSCTCHHETDLAWVNSFNCNICFKHKTDESCQTRQFRGSNIDCENHILWFAPHTFIFPLNIC